MRATVLSLETQRRYRIPVANVNVYEASSNKVFYKKKTQQEEVNYKTENNMNIII